MKPHKRDGKHQRGGRGDRPHWKQEKTPEADEILRIYGAHAVEAALRNPKRRIKSVQLTDNAEHRLAELLAARGLTATRVQMRDLERQLGPGTVHQGAVLEVEPLPEPSLEDLAQAALHGGPIVVLDQVTDPHNVGAILRSAAAFSASGLVMTRRHSPPLAGALAKAATGALEHVPVVLVPNLARALDEFGELGLTRIGLDGEASDPVESITETTGIALVLGAEGKGLRRLTRENCDRLCKITTSGSIESLNVSIAAAITLHTLDRRRAAGAVE